MKFTSCKNYFVKFSFSCTYIEKPFGKIGLTLELKKTHNRKKIV